MDATSNRVASSPSKLASVPRPVLALVLFALCLFVYTWKMQYRLEGQGGDTLPAQLIPISLLHEGNFDLNEFVDPSGPIPYSMHVVDGKVLSIYPILPAIVNTPVYWVAESLGLALPLEQNATYLSMITASIATALSVALMYLVFGRIGLGPIGSLGLGLLYAFGTGAWSTASRGIWQHGPSILFLSAALFFALGKRGGEAIVAAFFCGLAVINRAPDVLVVAPLLLLLVYRHPRMLVALGLSAALPLMAMRVYSHFYYGNFLVLSEYPMGVQNASAFHGNLFAGLAGLLFSPARGLLVYSPVLVFSVVPLFLRQLPREAAHFAWALFAGAAMYVLLHAWWYMWWGGTCYGYRVLIDILPALFGLLALYLATTPISSRLAQGAFALFAGLSVYAGMLGAMMYPCGPAFENRMDGRNPWLWSVPDSDLARCTNKLVLRQQDKARGQ